MLSIDNDIVADAWLEFNGCLVGSMVLGFLGEEFFKVFKTQLIDILCIRILCKDVEGAIY